MTMMKHEAIPTTGSARRSASTIEVERDDSRSRLLGTTGYRPGCIAGWGPKLG